MFVHVYTSHKNSDFLLTNEFLIDCSIAGGHAVIVQHWRPSAALQSVGRRFIHVI